MIGIYIYTYLVTFILAMFFAFNYSDDLIVHHSIIVNNDIIHIRQLIFRFLDILMPKVIATWRLRISAANSNTLYVCILFHNSFEKWDY